MQRFASRCGGSTKPSKILQKFNTYQKIVDRTGQGILKMDTVKSVYVFTQNYMFDSETHAANVILGVSIHGDERWKDECGTTLKEMRLRKAESVS